MARSVTIPDEVASELVAAAEARKITPDELATELIAERLPKRQSKTTGDRLSCAAVGASTSGWRACDDEQMLGEGFGR